MFTFIMKTETVTIRRALIGLMLLSTFLSTQAADPDAGNKPPFKVLAFHPTTTETAHMSFVREANKWFPKMGGQYGFTYEATDDWTRLNADVLSQVQVVLFLDKRPDDPAQRAAFKAYMDKGGGWMGFHFAGFALTPSEFPQNWDWYHNEFLGAGSYAGNTWRPTSAVLRVEDPQHPAMAALPRTFKAAPNEWYKWTNDLRTNRDITILLSIDASSFPLGTGPKLHEIWHEGYYPVVWSNKHYKMIYMNMGHNDLGSEDKGDKGPSSTFESEVQNRMILNSLLWLGRGQGSIKSGNRL